MQKIFQRLQKLLSEAASSCKSDSIALSGGLDSSILGYYLRNKKIKAIVVITKDFPSLDLVYSQLAAKEFGLELYVKSVSIEDLISGIEETIKILKVFNDIEVRNSVVMYLTIKEAIARGCSGIITGDGADELFAGYSFFLRKEGKELEDDLKRIWKVMHFPTQHIAKSLGIGLELPFLNESVVKYAKSIPANLKVREEKGSKHGKWILRKSFEKKLPEQIVWRSKSPMQDGSGTSGLTSFFENTITNSLFESKKKFYHEKEKVRLRSKESLYYYESYRKYYEPPYLLVTSKSRCPDCQAPVKVGSHFCRMCGSFPI